MDHLAHDKKLMYLPEFEHAPVVWDLLRKWMVTLATKLWKKR